MSAIPLLNRIGYLLQSGKIFRWTTWTRPRYSRIALNCLAERNMSSWDDHTRSRSDGYYENVTTVKGAPLTVRRALPDDHDDILAIDASAGGYDGGDYLFGKLRSYLKDPMRMSWVTVLRGKIVGFISARSTDGGHNMVGRIGRVERSLRGEGIFDALKYISTTDMMGRWPDARLYFACSATFHIPYFQTSHKWRLIQQRPFINMTFNKEGYISIPSTGIECSPLSTEKMEKFMEHPAQSRRLFPTGMVVIGREPFIVHQTNFDGMHKEYSTVQGSYSCKDDPEKMTGMSFGTGIAGKDCRYTYDCAIYCDSEDPDEFAQHLYAHVPIAQHLSAFPSISFHVFAGHLREAQHLTSAVKSLQKANPRQSFSNGKLKPQTYTLAAVPLSSYLESCLAIHAETKRKKANL